MVGVIVSGYSILWEERSCWSKKATNLLHSHFFVQVWPHANGINTSIGTITKFVLSHHIVVNVFWEIGLRQHWWVLQKKNRSLSWCQCTNRSLLAYWVIKINWEVNGKAPKDINISYTEAINSSSMTTL